METAPQRDHKKKWKRRTAFRRLGHGKKSTMHFILTKRTRKYSLLINQPSILFFFFGGVVAWNVLTITACVPDVRNAVRLDLSLRRPRLSMPSVSDATVFQHRLQCNLSGQFRVSPLSTIPRFSQRANLSLEIFLGGEIGVLLQVSS